MYNIVLWLHNISRWIVLILGFLATLRVLLGWFRNREWTETERKLSMFFTISMDIQILLGVLLYFIYSEWALKAILEKGFSFVMGQSEYRFFAIEHVVYMLLAIIFAHVGNSATKKLDKSADKFKRASIWFGLAMLFVLLGIPWGRPLFPNF